MLSSLSASAPIRARLPDIFMCRKPNQHKRAAGLRIFYRDITAVVLQHALHDRQAEPRAFGLCCKKGLKYAVPMPLGDSMARVLNPHFN